MGAYFNRKTSACGCPEPSTGMRLPRGQYGHSWRSWVRRLSSRIARSRYFSRISSSVAGIRLSDLDGAGSCPFRCIKRCPQVALRVGLQVCLSCDYGRVPRKFQKIEVLPDAPPFQPVLMEELSLHGLHCGSGRQLRPGWLNTDQLHFRDPEENAVERGRIARIEDDLYYLEHDSREPYPFESECFDWAYSEHFIEHVTLDDAIRWLSDIRRILKPGGHLRVTTPD